MTYPIGQTFNKLLVVEKVKKYSLYDCLCDCGNIKYSVSLYDLEHNRIKSCGCINHGQGLIKDISGNHYGAFTVIKRLDTKTTDGYDYSCKCSCGNEKIVKYNNLVRGDTKSCGCKSDYYNSVNNGGTGIPRENIEFQKAIRLCKQYRNFVKLCLIRANGVSEWSGKGGSLAVHHLNSVSHLIETNNLTRDNYLQCLELFNPANAVVLTAYEHRKVHTLYGKKTVEADWTNFTLTN
jgi:hypothetical protein